MDKIFLLNVKEIPPSVSAIFYFLNIVFTVFYHLSIDKWNKDKWKFNFQNFAVIFYLLSKILAKFMQFTNFWKIELG